MRSKWLFALFALSLPLRAQAADEGVANLPLSTDRPSFSDGATTVPVDHAQFDCGM